MHSEHLHQVNVGSLLQILVAISFGKGHQDSIGQEAAYSISSLSMVVK
jgi:hypothetical protein